MTTCPTRGYKVDRIFCRIHDGSLHVSVYVQSEMYPLFLTEEQLDGVHNRFALLVLLTETKERFERVYQRPFQVIVHIPKGWGL